MRGTHFNNCAYQTNCAFNVFVKDGRVVREEQIAAYPQTNQDVPDLNPRGCQKGCAYSSFMYSEPRLTASAAQGRARLGGMGGGLVG